MISISMYDITSMAISPLPLVIYFAIYILVLLRIKKIYIRAYTGIIISHGASPTPRTYKHVALQKANSTVITFSQLTIMPNLGAMLCSQNFFPAKNQSTYYMLCVGSPEKPRSKAYMYGYKDKDVECSFTEDISMAAMFGYFFQNKFRLAVGCFAPIKYLSVNK